MRTGIFGDIDFEKEGIKCNEKFLDYLQEKVKLLNLYYSYINTPWPKSLDKNNCLNYSAHIVETNYCDAEEQDICFKEKHYNLNYKICGNRQFFFDICPFHTNHYKTYALEIDDVKNLFFCHGCGRGGSNFEFIYELYNLSNISEAIRVLGTIELLTSAESEKNPFFLEQMKRMQAPYSLTPYEWKVVFHLTRNWNYDSLIQQADAKRKMLLQRVDNYIEQQYSCGRLTEEQAEDEELLTEMSNRICIKKSLMKSRVLKYVSKD